MKVPTERLREMLALAEAATPGPWDNDEPHIVYSMANGGCVYLANTADLDTPYKQSHADAAFIAACGPDTIRSALSELLELREAVKAQTEAARDVLTERNRQVESEGWTPEHDDEHTDGSLALAAVCYATPVKLYSEDRCAGGPVFFDPWPSSWDEGYDKRFRYGERRTNPGNSVPDPVTYTDAERRDLLVKGGALIIAEIERLDRARSLQSHTGEA